MPKKSEEKDVIGMIPNDVSLERQRRREAVRKKLVWAFSIFLAIAMVLVVVYVFSKFFFRIRTIEIKGADRYTEEQILEASGIDKDRILFTVRDRMVSSVIEAELPFIVSVTIKKDYPGTLVMTVKETEADFCFAISGQYVVVSKELKVLDVLESKDRMEALYGRLITIDMPGIQNAVVGKQLEFTDKRDTDFIPELLYTLEVCEMRQSIYSINAVTRFNIELNYEDRFVVQLGNTSDFETKLVFAKQIIASFKEGTTGTVCVEDPAEGFAIVDQSDNLISK